MSRIKLTEKKLTSIIKRTLNESQLITEEKCNVRCKYSHDVCPDGDDSGAKSWNAHGSVGMYGSSNCSEFGYSACATHCGTPGMVTPDGGDEIKKITRRTINESQLINIVKRAINERREGDKEYSVDRPHVCVKGDCYKRKDAPGVSCNSGYDSGWGQGGKCFKSGRACRKNC
tara:strand:- start:488 stop:1006 length:519 start_codon:yes stop_codon:yes gene_type:complete